MDPEGQQPIEADRRSPDERRERGAEPQDQGAAGGAGDRPGLHEQGPVDQHRERQTLEDTEVDGRGRLEHIGDRGNPERDHQELETPADVAPAQRAADPRQHNKEPGEGELGRRPGRAGQVGRKAEEAPDAAEFPQVEQDVVADHQDDGQAPQEIDLPDARPAPGGRSCRFGDVPR